MREIMSQAEIDADPAAWLKARRELITGSDIAGILSAGGAYSSPTSVYWSKVAGIGRPDNLAMLFGRWDEALIADLYAGEYPGVHPGYLPKDAELINPGLCVSDDRPWQGATFDRVEQPGNTVVEIKQTIRRDEFGTPPHGDIPLRHLIQALWEADVAQAPLVKLVVRVPPYGPFLCFWIVIDDKALEDQDFIRRRAEQFRADYLLPRRPPPADGSEHTTLALKSAYHVVDRETVVVPKRLWAAALKAQQRRDAANESLTLAKNRIAELQQDARYSITRDGQPVMQRSLSWPKRLDLDRLRAEFPEAAAACTVQPAEDKPEIRFLVKQPGAKINPVN